MWHVIFSFSNSCLEAKTAFLHIRKKYLAATVQVYNLSQEHTACIWLNRPYHKVYAKINWLIFEVSQNTWLLLQEYINKLLLWKLITTIFPLLFYYNLHLSFFHMTQNVCIVGFIAFFNGKQHLAIGSRLPPRWRLCCEGPSSTISIIFQSHSKQSACLSPKYFLKDGWLWLSSIIFTGVNTQIHCIYNNRSMLKKHSILQISFPLYTM